MKNGNDPNFRHSLVFSLSLHAFVLWLLFNTPVRFIVPIPSRAAPTNVITVTLVPPPDLLDGELPSRDQRSQQGTTDVRAGKIMSSRSRISENLPLPQSTESSLADTDVASTTDMTGASGKPRETVDESDRGVTISEGITSGKETTGRSAAGVKGSNGSSGSSDSGVTGALGSGVKGSATPSDVDSFSGAVIPGYVIDAAGYRPPEAGAIYPDVDKYVLYGSDKQTPISIIGTEVCIEGELLRSKEIVAVIETKVDYSQCRYTDFNDDSILSLRCPPESMTKIVHHNSYLSSPLVYSVRTCLEYDSSNCYMREDDANEREICRIDFRYEGIWAEGTKFYYKCAKSEGRGYKQSIEYDIRWFMEIEIHNKLTRRQVLRETKTVPRCSA